MLQSYGVWGEKSMYGKNYMGITADHGADRRRWPHRPHLAEGQDRGPRAKRCWRRPSPVNRDRNPRAAAGSQRRLQPDSRMSLRSSGTGLTKNRGFPDVRERFPHHFRKINHDMIHFAPSPVRRNRTGAGAYMSSGSAILTPPTTAMIPSKRIITVTGAATAITITARRASAARANGRAAPRPPQPRAGKPTAQGSRARSRSATAAARSASARWRSGPWSEPS